MTSPYVPLWVKTHFSFLEGASRPDELVERAHALGLPALAVTDRDGVPGIVRAHEAAKDLGLKLLFGSQLTVANTLPDVPLLLPEHIAAAQPQTPVLLAMNRAGYGNLCRLATLGRRRSQKGGALNSWQELATHADGLLLLMHQPPDDLRAPWLQDIAAAFGDRAYGLCARHGEEVDKPRERQMRRLLAHCGWQGVAGREVLYHDAARRRLQDVLTCIRLGLTLDSAGQHLKSNAAHDLLAPDAFAQLFRDEPSWLQQTRAVVDRCQFSLNELRYVYPLARLPDGTTTAAHFERLSWQGAAWRYPQGVPDDVRAQLSRELALIHQLDYAGYFLTMWEIVQFCNKQGILCQGRGSAANSVVCYVLGITAIDPVRMGLLFERFLSLERAEPPDIDLDIEHERREEVIQHVYGRYDPLHPAAKNADDPAACVQTGRSHAAMVCNVIRFRGKSAIREVGKVLGIPETDLDRASRFVSSWGEDIDAAQLKTAGFALESQSHRLLLELANEIQDFPRHLGIHPGGFLLGHEPIDTLVPIENATMEARTVIQWDKNDVEALGLFKVDLLGLGMLAQVHRCLDLLKESKKLELTMATIPAEDPATYAMISRGDTVGVFQIESRAQMAMLPRLQPRTFYDLVVEVAIVRPGPITGGMVHPYLRRRQGKEKVEYPHACLEPVLAKTLGVPLFQEQVMRLAMVAADYTPGEADQLRRDMAAWRRSGAIEKHHEKLTTRMVQKGIAAEFAERVFQQIRGFGEYGFPESHAASFALISYVTAWLKCHHPAEFTCALLNAWPMGFYSPATLVEDAKRHGLTILPIDVLRSAWDCTLESGAVRMGLKFVHGLTVLHRARLEMAPAPYADLDAFVRQTRLDKRALDALAEVGALDGLSVDRRQALWQVRALAHRTREPLLLAQDETLPLFAPLGLSGAIGWDYRRSGLSTRGHPLQPLRQALAERRLPTAHDINRMRTGKRVRFVGLVICRQSPGTASGVTFFTLEDETGFCNLVVWKDIMARFRVVARTASLLGVTGHIQAEDGVVHLIADTLWTPEIAQPVSAPRSRDFH